MSGVKRKPGSILQMNVKVKWSLLNQLAHRAGAYPSFRSMKRLRVFLLPLDGMLVHRRSLTSNLLGFPQQFAGTHLYSWVERGTVRVKCLAQEHNTMSPARAQTQSAWSRDKRTNHEATALPQMNGLAFIHWTVLWQWHWAAKSLTYSHHAESFAKQIPW